MKTVYLCGEEISFNLIFYGFLLEMSHRYKGEKSINQ